MACRRLREPFAAGVGDLYAYGRGLSDEPQEEVPSGHSPVANGVRGELGREQGERVVRLGGVGGCPRRADARRRGDGQGGHPAEWS